MHKIDLVLEESGAVSKAMEEDSAADQQNGKQNQNNQNNQNPFGGNTQTPNENNQNPGSSGGLGSLFDIFPW